ncbi:Bardet-Biedl syndrome 2 protein homolog [Ixodes scapularis]
MLTGPGERRSRVPGAAASVDGRHVTTGEVVFRDAFPHGVAGIVQADYCGDGREELIVCSVNGEVRGYLPTTAELRQQIVDATFEQDTVRELSQKKQMLQLEMRNYEGQAKTASGTPKGTTDQRYGTISAATQLKTLLAINSGTADISPHVEVALKTNNETVIHAVMLFAEGIFSGESFVHKHFHVFEVSRQLPKFAMYLLVDEARTKTPTGSVRFKLAERPQRVASWVNQNFLLPEDLCPDDRFNVTFVSLRELKPITIRVELNGELTQRSPNFWLPKLSRTVMPVSDLERNMHLPHPHRCYDATRIAVSDSMTLRWSHQEEIRGPF